MAVAIPVESLTAAVGGADAEGRSAAGITLNVAEVYGAAEETLGRSDGIYYATIRHEAAVGSITYSGAIRRWADARRDVARDELDYGELFGTSASILTADARYHRERDGHVVATSGRWSRCYGAGVAASAVLGCPGPTEESTTEVQRGVYDGRRAIVLVTTGTSRGSDETDVNTTRLYLDPDTYLPFASESDGVRNAVLPVRAHLTFEHRFIPADAVQADRFDPAAIGYAPPDLDAVFEQAPDVLVYWLGREFAGTDVLPALVLRGAFAAPDWYPGPRFSIDYAPTDDRFGPPLVTLQLFARAAWDASGPETGGHLWNHPCWAREEIALPDGRAVIFSGFSDEAARAARAGAGAEVRCPAVAPERFLAHAYLGDTVVLVNPVGRSEPGGVIRSLYDTREGIETLVRALERRRIDAGAARSPTPAP